MMYLAWAALNLALWLYFLCLIGALIFTGRRILQGKLRIFSFLLLAMGIGHVLSANNSDPVNKIMFDEKNESPNSRLKEITLDHNLSFDTRAWIRYSLEGDTLVPVSCSSSLIGFVCGFEWQLDLATIDEIRKDEEASYQIRGTLHWNLFGVNVYSEIKSFSEGR